MKNHQEGRNQLAALHDRHKRFSINVYDHLNSGEEKHMLEGAKKKLEETSEELENLKNKLHKG